MWIEKDPCVYILASKKYGTLYIGVTSDLCSRVREHKEKLVPGFTKSYGVDKLVYVERCGSMELAIKREKQLKEWRRAWKIELIEKKQSAVAGFVRGTVRTIRNLISPVCQPGESRDPLKVLAQNFPFEPVARWVPAFAGMTV